MPAVFCNPGLSPSGHLQLSSRTQRSVANDEEMWRFGTTEQVRAIARGNANLYDKTVNTIRGLSHAISVGLFVFFKQRDQ